MTEKLLRAERLFFNPLIWNLRPNTFEAYWDEADDELFVYDGRIFLPDSHHRHQAILKAMRAYREHPASYPLFDPTRQFKVELYFLDREDEVNYFFDKNQRPKPVALSKAYDLTTEDDLSMLAKRVLDKDPALDAGVNRVTDRLSKRAPHFLTLSTLREVMRTFAGSSEVEEAELEGLAGTAAEFLRMLADVRPELRVETPHSAREDSLASAAVMMHGYGALMNDYSVDVGRMGPTRARIAWKEKLARLAPSDEYNDGDFKGDFMSRHNPLWEQVGITKRKAETGALTTLNTGGARAQAARVLRLYLRNEKALSPSYGSSAHW